MQRVDRGDLFFQFSPQLRSGLRCRLDLVPQHPTGNRNFDSEMMHAAFLLLVTLTAAGAPSSNVCSYQDVLNYLNLTTDNSEFKVTRPVLDYTHSTTVELDVILYAILAVIEKTQTFIPFLWATAMWTNERISWDPADFCGITRVSVPSKMVWTPDIFIPEMIQKDESPNNQYVSVSYNGTVSAEENLRVVSTCKMDVHKFPFDTQSCSITIGSAIHSAEEVQFVPVSNSSRATQFSREVMRTQGEWEFLHLSVYRENITYYDRQWENLKYIIVMKRRPLLHVINFLLPILFFLTLDLASFFIADHRGEKLSFKVTVLLAISVLLLILNDILPAMSNNTPLIATYCIVIFALMLLSLLETILITYLMEQDSISQRKLRLKICKEKNVNTDSFDRDEKRTTCCPCVSQVLDGEKPNELLPVAEQVTNSLRSGEHHLLLLILEELKEFQKNLSLHLGCKDEGGWLLQLAAKINTGFFVFYVTTVFVFLTLMFREWSS